MLDWVSLLLQAIYYYGHLIGTRNFEVDFRTGRVFTTTRSTLCAMANNVIMVLLSGYKLIGKANFVASLGREHKLHIYVELTLTILRITAGLALLLNQWLFRSQLMLLVKDSLRLCLASPQLIRMSRWRIFLMFLSVIVIEFVPLAITFRPISNVDAEIFLVVVIRLWLSAILNLALAHHYLVMLCIRGQYNLLNAELRQVIEESKSLSYNPSRKGAFMTRCCALADQLDEIARLQDHLQSIVIQLDGVCGVQGLMVVSGYYVSAMATTCTAYRIFKQDLNDLETNVRDLILSFGWSFFFYMAGILNLFMVIHIQDGHKEMIRLLEERTLFAPGLDVRLEQSFEILQLQLIRNPLKMEVFKLFPISRQSTWALSGSILLHSISLIQYDIDNFFK